MIDCVVHSSLRGALKTQFFDYRKHTPITFTTANQIELCSP